MFDDADSPKKQRRKEKGREQNHWQMETEAQKLDDKPWKNRSLVEAEEVLPSMKDINELHAARTLKIIAGEGTDGFHQRFLLISQKKKV